MFEPDKQVVNPDVVRVWSARTLLGRLRNKKERVDNVENCRNMMSRATGTLGGVETRVSSPRRWSICTPIAICIFFPERPSRKNVRL
jgi:hypothetical protein